MTTDNDTSTKKLGELITDAVADIQVLIRKSIDLAVAELKESGRRALMSSLLLIAAILLLIVSGLLLIIALAFGFAAMGLPYWLAFLVDAGIFVLVAVVLLWFAKINGSKIKAPSAAVDAAQSSINRITETLTQYNDTDK